MEATGAGAVFSFGAALAMIINPAKAVKSALDRVPWPVSLSVPGLSLTLLSLQAGLDMNRVGNASAGAVAGFTFAGLAVGTAGVAAVGAEVMRRAGPRVRYMAAPIAGAFSFSFAWIGYSVLFSRAAG